MLNLVLNAMEAVASVPLSRRTVTLGWESSRDGRGTTFFVRDNGPGIAGDEDELFEPFLTTKKDGMGLGLAVSRFIAEDHGGSLDWERPEGGGSCFRLKLPRETPAP
jgi:C4-dicarboxylate-specific signal transduction histidine kinase